MNNQTQTDEGRRPRAALVLPEEDFGLAAAYQADLESAGWSVRRAAPEGPFDDDHLVIYDFALARQHLAAVEAAPPRALAMDIVWRQEYAANHDGLPFHLLDNVFALAHDFETVELIERVARPVGCEVVMYPYPGSPGAARPTGEARRRYAPAVFTGHPWFAGMEVEFTGREFPAEAPRGSMALIPEYHPAVWPFMRWAAASQLAIVAPGTPTFEKTLFYGALLFEPGAHDDFARKAAMLARPDPPRFAPGKKLNLAFVAPRYSPRHPGGAETHAAQFVRHLPEAGHAATLLTTQSDNMIEWNNNLPEGERMEDGARVIRFPVDTFDTQGHFHLCHLVNMRDDMDWAGETRWMRTGIRSSALERYLADHIDEFDAVILIPYLYAVTFWAGQIAPEKTYLIPCFHREGTAQARLVRQQTEWVAGVLYNTVAEQRMAEVELDARNPARAVVGPGVEAQPEGGAEAFRKKYNIQRPYLLYVGRMAREKNVGELLEDFTRAAPPGMELVLAGTGDFPVKDDPARGIRYLGFLPEEDKPGAYAGCLAFVSPSAHESFSLVIMEAWLQGRPVIANGRCEAVREHLFKCGGGILCYEGAQFAEAVERLRQDPALAERMGGQGREYVKQNFRWDRVTGRFERALRGMRPQPLTLRLGARARESAPLLELEPWNGFRQFLSIRARNAACPPVPDFRRPAGNFVDDMDGTEDIHTDYGDFSHRGGLGRAWSAVRGRMTLHLRQYYLEPTERKQIRYNRVTAFAIHKLYQALAELATRLDRLQGRGKGKRSRP